MPKQWPRTITTIGGGIILALSISACSTYRTPVSALIDPAYSPQKTDPIFLQHSDAPSIAERQAEAVLRNELCRGGFNVVPDITRAKWMMRYVYDTKLQEVGSTTRFYSGILYGMAKTDRTIAGASAIELSLYPVDGTQPIWQAATAGTEKVIATYQPVVFKVLLDQFGRNYHDRMVRLSKSYLYDVQDNQPCVPGQAQVSR